MADKEPSIFIHLRDMVALPFMVTVVIPFFMYRAGVPLFKDQPIGAKIAGAILFCCGLPLQLYTTWLFKNSVKAPLRPGSLLKN